jgi:hypothetical protein
MFTSKRVISALAVSGLFSLTAPAGASTVFDLNIISKTDIGSGTLGTVTLTQISANEVDVLVSLIANTFFVDTGGPHNAFAFNLGDAPSGIYIKSPLGGIFSVGGAGTNTPYGAFTNVINCPGCGNGSSGPDFSTLAFAVTDSDGISIGDFIANVGGSFFSADVIGPGGGTGNIAAAPIPAALPLFASGLGAIGLLTWWRRRKAEAVA